jgi:hypothetical protein
VPAFSYTHLIPTGEANAMREQYTIRRKFLKIFGAAFHVYDEHGSVIDTASRKPSSCVRTSGFTQGRT